MKIYAASSWRNIDKHKAVVAVLRDAGHGVYDFTDPTNGKPFSWAEIDENWRQWAAEDIVNAYKHSRAQEGFASDMNALERADACVLTMPCGRSAHLELGYAVGAGKRTVVYIDKNDPAPEADLMWQMADAVVTSIDEILPNLEPTLSVLDRLHHRAFKHEVAAKSHADQRRYWIRAGWKALRSTKSKEERAAMDDINVRFMRKHRQLWPIMAEEIWLMGGVPEVDDV